MVQPPRWVPTLRTRSDILQKAQNEGEETDNSKASRSLREGFPKIVYPTPEELSTTTE